VRTGPLLTQSGHSLGLGIGGLLWAMKHLIVGALIGVISLAMASQVSAQNAQIAPANPDKLIDDLAGLEAGLQACFIIHTSSPGPNPR
jgi:hypothetical protein